MEIQLSNINFVFVGMPSSGKSTIARLFSSMLNKKILECDQYYDQILNTPESDIAIEYYRLRFPDQKDGHFKKCSGSEDFIKEYGETLFRDYEEFLNIDILTKEETSDLILDLPGKIFMRENYRHKLKELGYISIFLNIDKDVLIDRLSYENSWAKRSIYKIAEENGYGWKNLFNDDYNIRFDTYNKADIVYTINNNEAPEKTVENLIDYIKTHLKK
ncbi:shikimate kinase [Plebeiibacterium sediminum]|uniref:Uncharacterized protein n=1 Tax=Plebeiibacterium sediminum TaxID=2992112 RepID=A0AAE3M412_9BACT|nr:shikimate kinase [Plebeiobacterium sediminum]MCW3786444.1 hypothetical protein [Plebeiobacterium sediminum]